MLIIRNLNTKSRVVSAPPSIGGCLNKGNSCFTGQNNAALQETQEYLSLQLPNIFKTQFVCKVKCMYLSASSSCAQGWSINYSNTSAMILALLKRKAVSQSQLSVLSCPIVSHPFFFLQWQMYPSQGLSDKRRGCSHLQGCAALIQQIKPLLQVLHAGKEITADNQDKLSIDCGSWTMAEPCPLWQPGQCCQTLPHLCRQLSLQR